LGIRIHWGAWERYSIALKPLRAARMLALLLAASAGISVGALAADPKAKSETQLVTLFEI
jgi:hypothetical protein